MKIKVCTRCKKEKTLAEFTKDKRRAFGKGSFCIPCRREWDRERLPYKDKKALNAAQERYREKNKEALKERRIKASIGKCSKVYFRQCEHEGCGKIDVLRKKPQGASINYCGDHNKFYKTLGYVMPMVSKVCAVCEGDFIGKPRATMCRACAEKRVKARRRKSKRFRSDKKRSEYYGVYHEPGFRRGKVFKRDKYRCKECGKKTIKPDGRNHPDEYTLGHIVPMVHGGPTSYTNCQCECRDCNTKKSTKLYGQQATIFMIPQSAVNQ